MDFYKHVQETILFITLKEFSSLLNHYTLTLSSDF